MTTATYSGGRGAEARGDLAEQMLPLAARLALVVRGDGGPEDVQEALEGLTDGQVAALVVVLAGLADPDRPLGGLLGWLDFDEYGRPTVPDWDDRTTLRQLAEEYEAPAGDVVDEIAVRAYVQGRRVAVTEAERVEAIRRVLAAGMTFKEFDALHGLSDGTTVHFVTRARKRAEARGEAFPDLVSVGAGRVFSASEVVAIRERSAAGSSDLEIALSLGVKRQAIQRIVCGDAHPDAGGPIRPKRTGHQPTAPSRALFAGKPA